MRAYGALVDDRHVAVRQKENSFRGKFERYIARNRHNADCGARR